MEESIGMQNGAEKNKLYNIFLICVGSDPLTHLLLFASLLIF